MSTTSLTRVAEGLWTAERELSFPGGFKLPARMTIMRAANGDLLVYSPIKPTPELKAEVAALGPVRHVLAPNKYHHLFVKPFAEAFPGSQIWVAPGLKKKRPDLADATELGDAAPTAWGGGVQAIRLDGAPTLNEVVLFHEATRSLVTGDLLFNVQRPANFMTKVVLTVMGTKGKLALSRIWRRLAKDRHALGESTRRMLDWTFTRVLPAHGEVAEDAHASVEAAVAWILAGRRAT